jgi:hypothetical protein
MEINFENPIFVVYLNVNGMGKVRVEELTNKMMQNMSFTNCTTWIMPIQEGEQRIDLIWQGSKYSSNPGIIGKNDDFIKTLSEIVEIVSNSSSTDGQIRSKIRSLLIDKLNID